MTPIMQLTLIDGTPCSINIRKVVLVEPRKTRNMSGGPDILYTYIVLSGGECITRNVSDSYKSVMALIVNYWERQ